ncbi:MAG: hypothetical protein AB7R55_05265 [Gemmatimonadales bacterium]
MDALDLGAAGAAQVCRRCGAKRLDHPDGAGGLASAWLVLSELRDDPYFRKLMDDPREMWTVGFRGTLETARTLCTVGATGDVREQLRRLTVLSIGAASVFLPFIERAIEALDHGHRSSAPDH